ncbi:MAG: glycosyltransferase family 4 protein [Vicinamibacterales bacterium]
MSAPLRILLVTDSFPPGCGGSGWSTWELAHGLGSRGHHVEVVKVSTSPTERVARGSYQGVSVETYGIHAPGIPFVRNLIKNEQLWRRLTEHLAMRLASDQFDIVHAQHVMTTVPAVRAGRAAGTPVVATVRDYWPVCYWSDLIYDPGQPALCPACSAGMMTKCIQPRAGLASLVAWPMIPYMRANLATKRRTLATADAVIAVSSTIARDLEARAPELAATPLYTIPNPVDMIALDHAYDQAPRPTAEPYLLYAGKIAVNKGVQYLLPAIVEAGLSLPLVVAGDGPLRGQLEAEARNLGVNLRVLGWRSREEVWGWMRHARLLAFPSYGPESLSRVLIEAAALGTPIAAMNTGGTPDIVHDRETGLLSATPQAFARDLAELAADERLRAVLGAAARADAHARFSATSVVERVEQVYRSLLVPRAA